MRGAFPIFRVRGIPIRVHWTFLLILPFLATAFGRGYVDAARLAGIPPEGLTWAPWLWGLLLAVGLFASVLGHELAHSLYALRTGVSVRSITLLMIGGVSEMGEGPRAPRDEAWMALVGPIFSLVLGGALLGAGLVGADGSFDVRFALVTLGQINLALGVFNLLPAFPMDGGRVLRALLAGRLGPVRATRIAAAVGKAFAIGFALTGLAVGNLVLLLIAFFVWMGAEAEGAGVALREVLRQVRVRDLAGPPVEPVQGAETLDIVVARMVRERRLALPVAEGGDVVGVLPLDRVAAVPPERRATTLVRTVAIPTPDVAPDDDAWTALRAMSEANVAELPIEEGGALVGNLAQADIARAVRLRELQTAGDARTGWRPREVEA